MERSPIPAKAGNIPRKPVSRPNSTSKLIFSSSTVFYSFLAVNLVSAVLAPILDCDETFNYWEPTHYLVHGYGLQTWEYSPEYAIRSWVYIALHAIPAKIFSFLSADKRLEFFVVRSILGLICALSETKLYTAISKSLSPRIGLIFAAALLTSPGMFHASTAFLPSSFAMYTAMVGESYFIDWRGGINSPDGVMWFGVGAIFGWPFAGALALPFYTQELVLSFFTEDILEVLGRLANGNLRCMVMVVLQSLIEIFFYHKLTIVPWNLVEYNVFGGEGKGPNIFGTESWDFYFRNLAINFNVWFVLALLGVPTLMMQYTFQKAQVSFFNLLRTFFTAAGFYMWLAIFTLQPHKEERFMYPMYPFLAFSAAITLDALASFFSAAGPGSSLGSVPASIRKSMVFLPVLLAMSLGLSRIFGVLTAYSSPMAVYGGLNQKGLVRAGDSVCIGKEWYRFPSSFFLPNNAHLKFVKSDFDGLLPGEFSEAGVGFGLYPGTHLIPPGMNDRNIADPGKLFNIQHCSFLIDSHFPSTQTTALEPAYINDSKGWETVHCEKFLDSESTSLIGRLVWLPESPWVPSRLRRHWGQYCLLKRKPAEKAADKRYVVEHMDIML